MAENSKIEWCTHTFNPWFGCTKVSAACDHCYAEALAKRFGTDWGKDAERRYFGEKHWNQPRRWNREAANLEERPRVFCASMADVFEDRRDLDAERVKLWALIEETPNLIWLLLTKRPHLMTRLVPQHWARKWPENVWAGTTVEDQIWADARIPFLLKVPSTVRFLSMEPLFGKVDLLHVALTKSGDEEHWIDALAGAVFTCNSHAEVDVETRKIDWVITGGESGQQARPGNPNWYRSLRDQSIAADVPFLFKQWGNWGPVFDPPYPVTKVAGERIVGLGHFKNKHDAGRILDGRTWDGYPNCRRPE